MARPPVKIAPPAVAPDDLDPTQLKAARKAVQEYFQKNPKLLEQV
jgi:hypothetical protein